MKKNDKNLLLLQTLYITCCVISPVLSSKLIDFGFKFGESTITIPSSAFVYAGVFLISNLVSALWSKGQAIQLCTFGFIGQFVSTVLFSLFELVPAYDIEIQSAYELILSTGIYFFISGAGAYFVSMLFNIWMYNSSHFTHFHKTFRSTVSMVLSQMIDSIVFLGLSYGLFLKWFFSPDTRSMLYLMILSQFIVRMLISILCVPIFNMLTHNRE